MPSIINKIAKESVSLFYPTGQLLNSEPVLASINVLAFSIDMTSKDYSAYASVKNGKIFFIPALHETPHPISQIIANNVTYDVQVIETIKNLKSKVLGYKFVVSSGVSQ